MTFTEVRKADMLPVGNEGWNPVISMLNTGGNQLLRGSSRVKPIKLDSTPLYKQGGNIQSSCPT